MNYRHFLIGLSVDLNISLNELNNWSIEKLHYYECLKEFFPTKEKLNLKIDELFGEFERISPFTKRAPMHWANQDHAILSVKRILKNHYPELSYEDAFWHAQKTLSKKDFRALFFDSLKSSTLYGSINKNAEYLKIKPNPDLPEGSEKYEKFLRYSPFIEKIKTYPNYKQVKNILLKVAKSHKKRTKDEVAQFWIDKNIDMVRSLCSLQFPKGCIKFMEIAGRRRHYTIGQICLLFLNYTEEEIESIQSIYKPYKSEEFMINSINSKTKSKNSGVAFRGKDDLKNGNGIIMQYPMKENQVYPGFIHVDYCDFERKLVVEYQGDQHYKISKKYKGDEEKLQNQIERDKFKEKLCKEKGFCFVPIHYKWNKDVSVLYALIAKHANEQGFVAIYEEFYEESPVIQEKANYLYELHLSDIKKAESTA